MAYHEGSGIQFAPPEGWEVEETEDGSRTTYTIQSPDGIAFALITVDEGNSDPKDLVAEALEAIRGEYPNLECVPAVDTLMGRPASGFDIAFITLDMTNAGLLRGVRTGQRTLFLLGQWSEIDVEDDPEAQIDDLFRSIEETEGN